MYISKKRALDLVGPSGIAEDRLRAAKKTLLATIKLIKDTDDDGYVDDFEVAAAVKANHLSGAVKRAIWSAYGTASFLDKGPLTTIDYVKDTIRTYSGYTIEDARRGVGHRLTTEVLQGQTVSNLYLNLLKLAKEKTK